MSDAQEPVGPPKPQVKRLLTLEEILHGLSELAESGEGAQRTQAYRMLLAERSGSAAGVPEPTTEVEIEEMAVMLFRWWGQDRCKRIWHLAFRKAKLGIDAAKLVGEELLSAEQRKLIEGITNLPSLYRAIPSIKKPGIPRGYPLMKGREAQKFWCRKVAHEVLVNRELEKAKEQDL